MVTITDPIRRLVERLSPAAVCEACIAGRLDIASADDVRALVGTLPANRGFVRDRGPCALCGKPGPAIRKRA